jgi:hypothetical protein
MNNIRTTLLSTIDAVNHHETGLVTDKGLEHAFSGLKAVLSQDSSHLVRLIKEEYVKKNNAMIARFMGIQDTDIGWYDCEDVMPECVHIQEGGNTFENLLFHKEWNWLMPVVYKCKNVDADWINDNAQHLIEDIDNALTCCYGVEEAQKWVVEFIKAYKTEKA